MANLCNLFNPECVIVGGGLGAAGELLGPLREAVRRNAIPSAVEDVEIVPGVLGERAELLGAVALVLHEAGRGCKHPRAVAEMATAWSVRVNEPAMHDAKGGPIGAVCAV